MLLVTGATGHVARAVSRLASLGHDVITMVRDVRAASRRLLSGIALRVADWHAYSSRPILNVEAADALEPVDIGGHDRSAGCVGMGGNEQVVAADRLSGRFRAPRRERSHQHTRLSGSWPQLQVSHQSGSDRFEIYFDPPSSRRVSTRCWFSSGVPMLIRSLSRNPSSLNKTANPMIARHDGRHVGFNFEGRHSQRKSYGGKSPIALFVDELATALKGVRLCATGVQPSSNSPPARRSASVQIRSTLNQA
jgi:hypothetical protein